MGSQIQQSGTIPSGSMARMAVGLALRTPGMQKGWKRPSCAMLPGQVVESRNIEKCPRRPQVQKSLPLALQKIEDVCQRTFAFAVPEHEAIAGLRCHCEVLDPEIVPVAPLHGFEPHDAEPASLRRYCGKSPCNAQTRCGTRNWRDTAGPPCQRRLRPRSEPYAAAAQCCQGAQ